jgi:hypothetical protein
MNTQDNTYIHMEDVDDVNYWANKLGISRHALNEIILQTGSIYIKEIVAYIKKHPSYDSSLTVLWHSVLQKMTFLN